MACQSSVSRNQSVQLTACHTLNCRIITVTDRSIYPSVSQPIGQIIDQSVCRRITLTVRLQVNQYINKSTDRSVDLMASHTVGQSTAQSIGGQENLSVSESVCRSVNLTTSHSVGRSIRHPFGQSVHHFLECSVVFSVSFLFCRIVSYLVRQSIVWLVRQFSVKWIGCWFVLSFFLSSASATKVLNVKRDISMKINYVVGETEHNLIKEIYRRINTNLTFRNLASHIYRTGVKLPSRCPILYIYSTNIRTEYFKHAV